MKLLVDIFSGQQIVSDSFNIALIYEGVGGKIKSRYIVKGAIEVDVGCGNQFGGAGQQQKAQDKSQKVIDLVDAFGYQQTSFGKKDYMGYIKQYMKKVKQYLQKNKPQRVAIFMQQAQKMVKFLFTKFDQITFYTPPSYDMQNAIILSFFENQQDQAPTFYYFLDGLRQVKL